MNFKLQIIGFSLQQYRKRKTNLIHLIHQKKGGHFIHLANSSFSKCEAYPVEVYES